MFIKNISYICVNMFACICSPREKCERIHTKVLTLLQTRWSRIRGLGEGMGEIVNVSFLCFCIVDFLLLIFKIFLFIMF